MVATDVPPSRLAVAQHAVAAFLETLPEGYRVGIVSFAQAARRSCPRRPTASRAARSRAPPRRRHRARRRDRPRRPGRAARAAPEKGKQPPASILVLSDGAQTQGVLEPLQAAQRARTLRIPVYTVAFGTDAGRRRGGRRRRFTQRVTVPPDPPTLRQRRAATGGRFYAAPDGDALNAVYEELGSRIGSVKEEREITAAFAAGGALLLLAAGAVSALRFGRIP